MQDLDGQYETRQSPQFIFSRSAMLHGSTIKRVSSADDRRCCLEIRHEVFTIEQGFPAAAENDIFDEISLHVLARCGGRFVGTASAVVSPCRSMVLIGLVAVIKSQRGRGFGSRLIRALELAPEFISIDTFVLDAESSARSFYERLGYVAFGSPFKDRGISQRCMRKVRL